MSSIAAGWPAYLDAPLEHEASRRVVVLALVSGLAFDVGMRSGVASVAGACAVAVVAAVMLSARHIRGVHATSMVAAAPLFGAWLAVRMSPWLLPFDIIAAAALLFLGASLAQDGSLFDIGLPQAAARAIQAATQGFLTPAFLIRGTVHGSGTKLRRIVRALAITVPLVAVLAALFASADAIFARAVDINVSTAVQHIVLVAIGTIGAGWLLRIASLRKADVPDVAKPTLDRIEWTIVLAGLDVVLAAFAVAQFVALSSGGKKLLHTAGFTYAEYARSGFFQLLAAVTITGLVLIALHASAERGGARFRVLAFAAIALTLVVVVSAFHRLTLYEHAYGLTMLRLYVHIAIVGAGLLLVVLAVRIAGVVAHRPWFAAFAGIVVLATLFGLNVANPEAFVARYNLSHRSAHFDPSYLGGLSTDAVPALAGTPAACEVTSAPRHGPFTFNLSLSRATTLRKEFCR